MTNKVGSGGIDNRPVQVSSDRAVKRTGVAGSGEAGTTAKAGGASTGVQITDSARQLAALEQAIRELPDVDEARVNEIRSAIADGSYKVSPDRIAEKLLRMEHELR